MADDSSNPKAIEMCETILKWLSDEGLYRDRVQDENLYFHLAAEFPARSGRYVNVIQPKNHVDMVVVFSRIKLAEVHSSALKALPEIGRERLLWEMRYALLFRESNFEFEPRSGDLESIRFSREIYYDGLSKNALMEALRENFKCELYVVWKFQELFDGSQGQRPRSSVPPEPMYI
jgi:hypothetical protein